MGVACCTSTAGQHQPASPDGRGTPPTPCLLLTSDGGGPQVTSTVVRTNSFIKHGDVAPGVVITQRRTSLNVGGALLSVRLADELASVRPVLPTNAGSLASAMNAQYRSLLANGGGENNRSPTGRNPLLTTSALSEEGTSIFPSQRQLGGSHPLPMRCLLSHPSNRGQLPPIHLTPSGEELPSMVLSQTTRTSVAELGGSIRASLTHIGAESVHTHSAQRRLGATPLSPTSYDDEVSFRCSPRSPKSADVGACCSDDVSSSRVSFHSYALVLARDPPALYNDVEADVDVETGDREMSFWPRSLEAGATAAPPSLTYFGGALSVSRSRSIQASLDVSVNSSECLSVSMSSAASLASGLCEELGVPPGVTANMVPLADESSGRYSSQIARRKKKRGTTARSGDPDHRPRKSSALNASEPCGGAATSAPCTDDET
jgi:hypothetical protein